MSKSRDSNLPHTARSVAAPVNSGG